MEQAVLMNIGNSHTQIATYEKTRFELLGTLETKLLLKTIPSSKIFKKYSGFPCIAACVVPPIKTQLTQFSSFKPVHWVNPDMNLELDFSMVEKSTLGADRIANAVAAIHEFSLPVIILDCGTAITTEVIDSRKRFLGGSITPGRHLARWALNKKTGQLPMAEYSIEVPRAIGRNTSDAIKSGVDLGLLGAIEKILEYTRCDLNESDSIVIAVGGDRHFFSRHLDCVVLGPDDLTLKGLALIAERL